MTDAPKIDTQAPERIWVTGEYSIWSTFRSFNASDLDHRNDDGTSDYPEYVRADLADARAAAAWIEGRDAAAEDYKQNHVDGVKLWEFDGNAHAAMLDLDPPTDASAALDRLIAERVREAIQPIKEAWDWWQADSYDRDASVVVDAIDEAMNAARGSKEGQS
ncbi:hypothetical protein [Paracoccus sp. 22332]|uniref:hypothetical protein n=1 Tax=Paracoccus sp. 22332 TaxID=3453913 RepID=UPI003F835BE7